MQFGRMTRDFGYIIQSRPVESLSPQNFLLLGAAEVRRLVRGMARFTCIFYLALELNARFDMQQINTIAYFCRI